jgi:hypothetical protein
VIPYHEDSSLHAMLSQKFRFNLDSSVLEKQDQLFLQNIERNIGLPGMTNKGEGLYIRIWVWDVEKGGQSRDYIINIAKNYSNKECSVIEFTGKTIDNSDYIIIHNVWENLTPKSGWNKFFETIDKYQIPSMKSGKSYKNQTEFLTKMAYVQFEIVNRNAYRFYEYLEPSFYRHTDTGSNNVYQFLKYFNDEMKVHIYNPY